MNRKIALVGCVLLGLAVSAQATIMETESNNDFGTSNPIAVTDAVPFVDIGVLSLASGGADVDFFSLALKEGQILTVALTPLSSIFVTPDTLLGVFTPSQVEVASDDNSYSGKGSMVQYQATASGTYYIAVTGSGDLNFDGNNDVSGLAHGKVGTYQMMVGVVPEPATLAFMGLTGLGMLFRQKK